MPGSVEWQMMQISQYRSQFQDYCTIPEYCFDHELGIQCLKSVRLEAKGWVSGKNGNRIELVETRTRKFTR